MEDMTLDKDMAVDDVLFIATNRFTLRKKLRKYLDEIRQINGRIKYFNWRPIYSAHERSVKWSCLIVYQAQRLIP